MTKTKVKKIERENNKDSFCITRAKGFLYDDNIERRWQRPDSVEYPYHFRLLDGDKEIYFYGYSGEKDSFEPLDCYGRDYGCITIEYYNNDKKEWEIL